VEDATRTGRWLFRWRSYLPVVVLAWVGVVVAVDPTPFGGEGAQPVWVAFGFLLGAAGLAFRGWALGYVPSGTSGRDTRRLRAETLNTTGLYSVVRHPLYFGNSMLWLGVAGTSGKPMAILVTALVFWLYYERIMMAEERHLYEEFGDAYGRWARRTPVFFPRLRGWEPADHRFSLRFCLGRDYQAPYGFVAATTLLAVIRSSAAGRGWLPGRGWAVYFLAGTTAYLVLHALKTRTRLLEVRDR
jgi:protein-S-isoprenylcysteine O-methyltransferase Ste14